MANLEDLQHLKRPQHLYPAGAARCLTYHQRSPTPGDRGASNRRRHREQQANVVPQLPHQWFGWWEVETRHRRVVGDTRPLDQSPKTLNLQHVAPNKTTSLAHSVVV